MGWIPMISIICVIFGSHVISFPTEKIMISASLEQCDSRDGDVFCDFKGSNIDAVHLNDGGSDIKNYFIHNAKKLHLDESICTNVAFNNIPEILIEGKRGGSCDDDFEFAAKGSTINKIPQNGKKIYLEICNVTSVETSTSLDKLTVIGSRIGVLNISGPFGNNTSVLFEESNIAKVEKLILYDGSTLTVKDSTFVEVPRGRILIHPKAKLIQERVSGDFKYTKGLPSKAGQTESTNNNNEDNGSNVTVFVGVGVGIGVAMIIIIGIVSTVIYQRSHKNTQSKSTNAEDENRENENTNSNEQVQPLLYIVDETEPLKPSISWQERNKQIDITASSGTGNFRPIVHNTDGDPTQMNTKSGAVDETANINAYSATTGNHASSENMSNIPVSRKTPKRYEDTNGLGQKTNNDYKNQAFSHNEHENNKADPPSTSRARPTSRISKSSLNSHNASSRKISGKCDECKPRDKPVVEEESTKFKTHTPKDENYAKKVVPKNIVEEKKGKLLRTLSQNSSAEVQKDRNDNATTEETSHAGNEQHMDIEQEKTKQKNGEVKKRYEEEKKSKVDEGTTKSENEIILNDKQKKLSFLRPTSHSKIIPVSRKVDSIHVIFHDDHGMPNSHEIKTREELAKDAAEPPVAISNDSNNQKYGAETSVMKYDDVKQKMYDDLLLVTIKHPKIIFRVNRAKDVILVNAPSDGKPKTFRIESDTDFQEFIKVYEIETTLEIKCQATEEKSAKELHPEKELEGQKSKDKVMDIESIYKALITIKTANREMEEVTKDDGKIYVKMVGKQKIDIKNQEDLIRFLNDNNNLMVVSTLLEDLNGKISNKIYRHESCGEGHSRV